MNWRGHCPHSAAIDQASNLRERTNMPRKQQNPHAELCAWANGLRPDSPQRERLQQPTPGPWVVTDFCTEGGADVAIWTSNDPHTAKSICECHFNTVREIQRGEHGCHQLEAEANARLIAAAPDLLRALIDLGDWLAYGMNKAAGAEPTAEDHATCERVAAQARAAIDKATR